MNRPALPDGLGEPLVTVILPTHRHAGTVDLAARSVLEQSVSSLELVVIGDGVTPEVREAVVPLLSDPRVRFLDRPKAPSRAERVRHEVLRHSTAPYVCYLGDDDLMLPDHLAVTVERLADVDFTHPLPVFIDRDATFRAHMTDLAEPSCRRWHQHPLRNAVSLTGVGHRLDAYLRLPHGWREAPPDRWSDHYMWQQWFAGPECRYATGDRLTVLKFEASARVDMTDAQRRAEILAWLERSRQPDFDAWLAGQAADAIRHAGVELRLALDSQADHFAGVRAALAAQVADARTEAVQRQGAEQAASARAAEVHAELQAVQASRTWRTRDRLVRLLPASRRRLQ